jgi:hypothetical protein
MERHVRKGGIYGAGDHYVSLDDLVGSIHRLAMADDFAECRRDVD